MKAVNQSIGRAIRHAGDYATVILVDRRYSRASITKKLPNWIAKSLVTAKNFGEGFSQVTSFFKAKKENQVALENERRAKETQRTQTQPT